MFFIKWITVNEGNEFHVVCSEWSSLENEMGDGLQKSGHYMDRSDELTC